MALADFVDELDQLSKQAAAAFSNAADVESLEAARIEFLGAKSGRLKATQKQMGKVDKADRPEAGKRLNQVKQAIELAFESANQRLVTGSAQGSSDPTFDPSLPGTEVRYGRLHPITQTIDELKDIMGRLGFSAAEGPEIEDEWHNFEALNIPESIRLVTRWIISICPRPTRLSGRMQAMTSVAAQPDQHGSDPRDGKDAAADPDYFAGPRLSTRHG